MSNTMTVTRVFWLFAVGGAFTPAARAIEPSAVSTSGAGAPHSNSDSTTLPGEPGSSASPESSFERALRLRMSSSIAPSWSRETEAPVEARGSARDSSLVTPDVLDGIERRNFAEEFKPTVSVADADANPDIPNHPALSDRFFFGAGVFGATSSTEAQLNSSVGLGTNVDFEDALGLDENDLVPQGLARWRFSERWRLELEYFALNRTSTQTIDGDITWGDDTFQDGTPVQAKFDISVMRLSCGYSFFKTQDKEIGVALGFHVTDINAQLSQPGSSNDEGKLLAPLPVISMYGQCALTDTWAVAGRFDAFRLKYDPYEGHVYSIGIDALCQPWPNFGFGIGFRSLQIGASVSSNDWNGELSSNYSGPIAFASVSF